MLNMSIFQYCKQISIVICYDFSPSFKQRFTSMCMFLFTISLFFSWEGLKIFEAIRSDLAGSLCFPKACIPSF